MVNMIKRNKYLKYWQELSASKEMIFLSGPRQSGKTTLAEKMIGSSFTNLSYFNYDFIESNKPRLLIEAKLSNTNPSKSLVKFQRYLDVPGIQLVLRKETARIITNDKNKIFIVSAPDWLGMLP